MAKKKSLVRKAIRVKFSRKQRILFALFLGGYLGVLIGAVIYFIIAYNEGMGPLPSFKEIENPNTNVASRVYSSDGVEMGKYYRENRLPVSFDSLPDHLINALIAIEDRRFYTHSGIDFYSFSRAVFKLGQAGGASTITQQLAKMLFTVRPSRNIFSRIQQKIKEWVISVELESYYTKNEIIEMYLNKFDFLYQAVGISSAARIYFGTTPSKLSLSQSAMLVAMVKNPSLYNPIRFKKRATERRNLVFKLMEENGFITLYERDSLIATPLGLHFKRLETHDDGLAPYFREYLRGALSKWIKANPKADGTHYDIYSDGLRIHTTIDSRMQRYAEEAVTEHISNLQRIFFEVQASNSQAPFVELSQEEEYQIILAAVKNSDRYRRMRQRGYALPRILKEFEKTRTMKVFTWAGEVDTLMSSMDSIRYYKHILQSGLMAINPITGNIKAWVGGINHKYFKYDHVQKSKRQVGSTFKPFVYAAAIDQLNLSPCYKLPNTKVTFKKEDWGIPEDWTPRNAGRKYGGMKTLQQALATSTNVITARLIKEMGSMDPIVDLVKNMGVTTRIPRVPAVSLGVSDVSVYDMVGAYSVFANKGVYNKPKYLSKIEDKNGVLLASFTTQSRDVLTEEKAYVMLKIMEKVTTYGTGVRLKIASGRYPRNCTTGFPYKFTNTIAGKTGTTQNHSDGWFIGMVPNLVTGVWVGNQDRAARFESITYGQGATMALPIWALFMKKCYADPQLAVSKGEFAKPYRLSIPTDCSKGNFSREGKTRYENAEEIDF